MRATTRLMDRLTLQSLKNKGAEQWGRLSARERVSLGSLVLFLVGVLIYSLIVLPGLRGFENSLSELQSNRELNTYVRSKLGGFVAAGPSGHKKSSASIQDLVIRSAKSEGVDIERYELAPSGTFSVSIPRVDFYKLVGWIGYLERNDVQVEGLTLSRVEQGVVSCSLVVKY